MYKSFITIVAFALLSSGCVHVAVSGEPLKPSDLNAVPEHYDGKDVQVRGYLKLTPEGHVIYESEKLDAEMKAGIRSGDANFDIRTYARYCLTIENPGLFNENRALLNGKTVVLTGRFDKAYLNDKSIDLGACPLPTGLYVDVEDFKTRYADLLRSK